MRSHPEIADPLAPFLDRQGVVILDGGLATELEGRGCALADDLWSARVLVDRPELIAEVHLDYLRAGADCIVSASYQATIEGFIRCGFNEGEATDLLRRSVELALEARDAFWSRRINRRGRIKPIVAASVGPYGAFLADGSEFSGDYGLGRSQLEDFHRRRWKILATSGADLLACETLPSRIEARALQNLLKETPAVPAWFSFSCGSELNLNDGSPISEVVAALDGSPQIVGLGVNCTAPGLIAGLLESMHSSTSKPLIAYPNSGELWNAEAHRWSGSPSNRASLAAGAKRWLQQGARVIGGCCRTGPEDIAVLRQTLCSEGDQA